MRTIIRILSAACILRPVSGFVGRVGVAIGGCGGGVDVFAPPPPRPSPSLGMTNDRRVDGAATTATATTATTTTSTSTTSTDDGIDRTTTIPPPAIASSPLPPSTFAGQVERALLSKFPPPSKKIERVLASWRYLDAGYEHREYVGGDDARGVPPAVPGGGATPTATSRCYQHAPSYVPGLRARAWWDDHLDDDRRAGGGGWAGALADSYAAIRGEFEKVAFAGGGGDLRRGGNNVWAGALTSDAESYGEGWKTLVLLNRGQWDEANANLFPVTSRAIRSSGVPVVEAFFASMEPRSVIRPHSDFTNFVLTCHLPLIVPENGGNKCRLTVGDETREWTEGRVSLFDTSIYHDAVNDSDSVRYILMMRVWHPDLSDDERDALQFVYDCLEVPELLSEDADVAKVAARLAASMREFPLEEDEASPPSRGFGGGNKSRGGKKGGKNDGGGGARRKGGGGRGFGP